MKILTFKKVGILSIMLALMLIFSISFGDPFLCNATASIEDIEVIIKTQKNEYLLGEPVVVSVEVKNNGSEDVEITGRLNLDYGDLVFYFKKSGGKEQLFKTVVIADGLIEKTVLKPGDSMYSFAKIFFGAQGWTFKEPGDYNIRAEFLALHDVPKKIPCNEISINIIKPKTAKEEEQARLTMGGEQGLFLLWEEGDHLVRGIRKLEQLTREYPDSIHSAYANYALGMSYSKKFFDFKTKRLRKPQYEKSIEYLRKAKEKDIDAYLQRNIYLTLSASYNSTGQLARANETLNEFITKFAEMKQFGLDIDNAKKMLRKEE